MYIRFSALLFILCSALIAQGQDEEAINKEIKLKIIKPSNSLRLPMKPEEIDLGAANVTVNKGETVSDILASHGIHSDVHSLGVVYDLNPELSSVDEIRPGQKLNVPKVENPSDVKVDEGFMVYFDAYPGERREINLHKNEFRSLLLSLPDRGQFESEQQKKEILDSVETVTSSLKIIGSPRAIVSEELLSQSDAEVELVNSLLVKLQSQGLTNEEQKKLLAAKSDLEAKAFALSSGSNPNIPVSVNTILASAEQVHNLRVLYVAEALDGTPEYYERFEKLTSPATKTIAVADYLFWAEKDGTTVSEKLPVKVRRGSDDDVRIDLLVQE